MVLYIGEANGSAFPYATLPGKSIKITPSVTNLIDLGSYHNQNYWT